MKRSKNKNKVKESFKMKQFVIPISEEKRRLKELKYTLYTDGSCDNSNTKRGGWAAYIIDPNDDTWTISGACEQTTSNRMEMKAIIEGLDWILNKYDKKMRKHVRVSLYSDSTYCINLIREWLKDWKEKGWDQRPNADLLPVLDEITSSCQLQARWIPRNSSEGSSLCDKLANEMRLQTKEEMTL